MDAGKRLQTIQNRSARRILDQLPGASATPLFRELGWINLASKRKLHKIVLLHNLLKDNGPKALRERLTPYRRTASILTRGGATNNLYIQGFQMDYVKKSFFHDTVKLWNGLPSDLKAIEDNKVFKKKLQAYFFVEDC